jgi:hypothetical protein
VRFPRLLDSLDSQCLAGAGHSSNSVGSPTFRGYLICSFPRLRSNASTINSVLKACLVVFGSVALSVSYQNVHQSTKRTSPLPGDEYMLLAGEHLQTPLPLIFSPLTVSTLLTVILHVRLRRRRTGRSADHKAFSRRNESSNRHLCHSHDCFLIHSCRCRLLSRSHDARYASRSTRVHPDG